MDQIRVSILVKALNEEGKIAGCLASAVREARAVDGEVILADSLSVDRTVEIARPFSVRIVQLARASDRSCGAATQLGFQFARGKYLYVVDGDMELEPGFLPRAIEELEANCRLAGVGGLTIDTQVVSPADKLRVERYGQIMRPMQVDCLGGGDFIVGRL